MRIFCCLFALPLLAQTVEPDSILQRTDAYRNPLARFVVHTRITSYEHGKVKDEGLFVAYFDGDERSLVIQREGKNRDMKVLYDQEMLWVQLPGSKRPLRITPMQRLMGEASNGDVARMSLGADYKVISAEPVEMEDPCWRLRLTARRPSATYQSIELFVHRDDSRPLMARFFVRSGKHIKTAWYQIDQTDSGSQVTGITIRDELRPECVTVMTYSGIQARELPARYFNKNYLVYVRDL